MLERVQLRVLPLGGGRYIYSTVSKLVGPRGKGVIGYIVSRRSRTPYWFSTRWFVGEPNIDRMYRVIHFSQGEGLRLHDVLICSNPFNLTQNALPELSPDCEPKGHELEDMSLYE